MADTNPLLAAKVATATEATRERKETYKFYQTTFLKVALGILAFIAIIVGGYMLRSHFNFSSVSLWHGIVLGFILMAISWAMPKFKEAPWLTDAIGALGLVIIVLAFANSGFGKRAETELQNAERCFEFQDCGPRSDDVPLINGGTIDIPAGTTKVVRIVGRVAVQNRAYYCLNISPHWSYQVEWTPDARRIYLTQLDNGDPPVTTITSIPVGEADCT